jgi:hypothetical protein
MVKAYYIIAGIATGFFGLMIIINPKYYDPVYGHYFDFTGVRWIFGGFLIAIGLLFILSTFKNKKGGK